MASKRSFRLLREPEGLLLDLAPLYDESGASIDGNITLGWYWFLPNIRRLGRRRYYEVAVQTNPFPTKEMLEVWQRRGANVVRIHNDVDSINGSDDYWHDGRHPPFEPSKMKQLRQFVDMAHQLGMKVINYFSAHELSPDTALFAQHAEEWYSSSKPRGKKRYTGSVYGCLMCPESGWIKAFESNIKMAIQEIGLDGFYLDWTDPQPCFNERHLPGHHNGIDGLVALLERIRRELPDILIVNVSPGKCMMVHNHNIADQYVTFEEVLKDGGAPQTLSEYPCTIDFMGTGVGSLVPDVLSWDKRKNLRPLLVQALLFGLVPYDYYYRYQEFGYADWKEAAEDQYGIFAAMEQYARHDWSKYHFYSCSTKVAISRLDEIGAAVYLGDNNGILLAGNLAGKQVGATSAQVFLERTPFGKKSIGVEIPSLEGWQWAFVPFVY